MRNYALYDIASFTSDGVKAVVALTKLNLWQRFGSIADLRSIFFRARSTTSGSCVNCQSFVLITACVFADGAHSTVVLWPARLTRRRGTRYWCGETTMRSGLAPAAALACLVLAVEAKGEFTGRARQGFFVGTRFAWR